jgi:hypothetical protein
VVAADSLLAAAAAAAATAGQVEMQHAALDLMCHVLQVTQAGAAGVDLWQHRQQWQRHALAAALLLWMLPLAALMEQLLLLLLLAVLLAVQ